MAAIPSSENRAAVAAGSAASAGNGRLRIAARVRFRSTRKIFRGEVRPYEAPKRCWMTAWGTCWMMNPCRIARSDKSRSSPKASKSSSNRPTVRRISGVNRTAAPENAPQMSASRTSRLPRSRARLKPSTNTWCPVLSTEPSGRRMRGW